MKTTLRILALCMVAVLMVGVLAACAPNKDPDKAVAALKKNEYTAAKDSSIIPAALTLTGVKGVDCVVTGTKTVEKDGEKTTESVIIIYFTDSSSAKEAMEKVKSYYENDKDAKEDWKQSGKILYSGTKAAVKAAH